jgi:hypothetical protein
MSVKFFIFSQLDNGSSEERNFFKLFPSTDADNNRALFCSMKAAEFIGNTMKRALDEFWVIVCWGIKSQRTLLS